MNIFRKKMKKKQRNKWVIIIVVVVILWLLGNFFVGIIKLFLFAGEIDVAGNIAVIHIKGIILTSKDPRFFYEESTISSDVVKFIERAEKNPAVKAILFEINSPGGSAVASDEIGSAIKKTKKFTVSVIRDTGASGAYWIASATDLIIANKMSITGSIGVISSYLEFSGLLDKYGVEYQRLVSGKYKDIASPFRNMTAEEERIFQKNLDTIRDYFIEEVAKNRNMSKSKVRQFSEGLFYIGSEAKELGLIDVLGNKDDAVKIIEDKFNITADLVEYKEKKTFMDIISDVFSRQSFRVGQGIGSSLFRESLVNDLSIYT